jgi:SAM-dependent methyltransferase
VAAPNHRAYVRMSLPSADLAAAWNENSRAFIAWARTPDHDSYWHFHRDLFLELVPDPGRRTLDLGCGEGRLSRDLKKLGHVVVGIDASERMVLAARERNSEIDVQWADAAALPFSDAEFDLVVAFMSLQDIDDFASAIREAGRVLEAGGRFCLAIVHPLNSAGSFKSDDRASAFTITGSYLDPSYYRDDILRDGLEMSFVSAHRPLQAYAAALEEAGFVIERLREPALPERAIRAPRHRRWQRLPMFLHLRAVKR